MSYCSRNAVVAWMVIGGGAGGVETFLPGAVAIWFAASAAFIGLLLHCDSDSLAWQSLALRCSASSRGAVSQLSQANPIDDEQPNLNQRGLQYVGSELVLVEPIAQGSGKAKLGDGVWKVSGPELPAGARVRVTGVNGTILTVIPA